MTLILPNVPRTFLEKMLTSDDELCKELDDCFVTTKANSTDMVALVTSYCLCEDDLNHIVKLESWWSCFFGGQKSTSQADLVQSTKTDREKRLERYKRHLARFVRPMTTVMLTTDAQQQASWMGHSQRTLHPGQFRALASKTVDSCIDLAIFMGPPLTGKTALLIVKGSEWVREMSGVVHVLKRNKRGCSTVKIYHDLMRNVDVAGKRMVNVSAKAEENQKVKEDPKWRQLIETLLQHDPCNVLVDDTDWETVEKLKKDLQSSVGTVRICVAINDVRKNGIPKGLRSHVRELTEPIMMCPNFLPLLSDAIDKFGPNCLKYSGESGSSGAGELGAVQRLPMHTRKVGPDIIEDTSEQKQPAEVDVHSGEYPWRCRACAAAVAVALKDKLQPISVGGSNPQKDETTQHNLSYRDVFILAPAICSSGDPDPLSPKPFLEELKKQEIPSRFINPSNDEDLKALIHRDVFHMDRKDEVIMANQLDVGGLRRRVVVYLDSGTDGAKASRLFALSRATDTIMLVDVCEEGKSSSIGLAQQS